MLGFTIGLRGIMSSQQAMDVIGQNITNFATDGYTRKLAILGPSAVVNFGRFGATGTGVQVVDVQRVQSQFLDGRIREEAQLLGASRHRATTLSLLGGMFGNSEETSAATGLQSFFGSLSELTGNPSDPALRSSAVNEAQSVAADFRRFSGQMDNLTDDARIDLMHRVDEVNSLGRSIADLNRRIQSVPSEQVPGELLDEQERLLGELASLTDFDVQRTKRGTVDVLLDGRALVFGDRADQLRVESGTQGIELRLGKSDASIEPEAGELGALLELANDSLGIYATRYDELARNMMLEFNRVHTTGVPADGSYSSLTAEIGLADRHPGRELRDIRLSELETTFPVKDGVLTVNVVSEDGRSVRQQRIALDADRDTVGDLIDRLNAVEGLSADLDGVGRLQVDAATGYGFDFSARLDVDPDDGGTFGSTHASLAGLTGPFALQDGDQLEVEVDGGAPQTLTFNAGDFVNIQNASAGEVAAAINAQVAGAEAKVVDGRIVMQSISSGETSQLRVTDAAGSPRSVLGFSDALELGSDDVAQVTLAGSPETYGSFELVPLSDGVVGQTPGLQLAVRNEDGRVLGTVDIGEGYSPGDELELLPGVTVAVEAGALSAESGDFLNFDLVEDGDTSDVLVALELGTMFTGTGAGDIDVVSRISEDSRQFATSRLGAVGDGDNVFRMLEIQSTGLEALNGLSVQGAYSDLVGDVGFAQQTASRDAGNQQLVLDTLERQRDSISGVNLDEEMLRLLEMQQLNEASLRYVAAMQETADLLFQLV